MARNLVRERLLFNFSIVGYRKWGKGRDAASGLEVSFEGERELRVKVREPGGGSRELDFEVFS